MIFKNEVQSPVQIPDYITPQANFIFRARMLWRDLATWLRSYKVSLFGGIGNTDVLSERLFQLPSEYGNILRVFFGDQNTEAFVFLLTQYITILQSLFIAQINNDVNAINDFTQQAYQNVNRTAEFLASINPYWTRGDWVALLSSFTTLQIEESTTFSTGDYMTNINIFDRLISLTNIIGDYFSQGLTDYLALTQQPTT
ncbi:MAG: hypothetical protein PHX63_08305 [Eubacteriales bacterium]|nr:hypothetical protein [Eubacteriales bacterium]